MASRKAAVDNAIEAIVDAHGHERLRVVEDDQGGAWVEISGIDPGPLYNEDETFLICHLPFNLPAADIYPMFVRPDLTRKDGAGLGEGTQQTELRWPGDSEPRRVTQLSRRTRNNAFGSQTAAQKVSKVLEWLASR